MTTKANKKRLKDLEMLPKGRTLVKKTTREGIEVYVDKDKGRRVKLDRMRGGKPKGMPQYAFRYLAMGPKISNKISNE